MTLRQFWHMYVKGHVIISTEVWQAVSADICQCGTWFWHHTAAEEDL